MMPTKVSSMIAMVPCRGLSLVTTRQMVSSQVPRKLATTQRRRAELVSALMVEKPTRNMSRIA